MTTVFRLTGADFSGKGLPNLFPFVAKADLEYAFDFRNRATRLIDLVGKHVITPKRNDPSAAIVNVTDPTIITTADNGLGITVDMGYLQCNLPLSAIPTGGGKAVHDHGGRRIQRTCFPSGESRCVRRRSR